MLKSVEGLHCRLSQSDQFKNTIFPVHYLGLNKLELIVPVCYSMIRFILLRQKRYRYRLKKRPFSKKQELCLVLDRNTMGWLVAYRFRTEEPNAGKRLFLTWAEFC
ncbi:hypothetical protein [Sediminispirochaeta bajacaliforniensis]|uniref:hypothetical protein n=1 Tax=Sediminispirochaeta bajacaliforniensis TaxID=148 RepID=UPI0012B5E9C7|nr:hypothetical protein [Sediminispirochaeta bajacaliforniensis]